MDQICPNHIKYWYIIIRRQIQRSCKALGIMGQKFKLHWWHASRVRCMFLRSEHILNNFHLDVKTAPKKTCNTAPVCVARVYNPTKPFIPSWFDSLRSIHLHFQGVLAVSAGLKFEKNGMEEYQKWIRRLTTHVWVAAAPAERVETSPQMNNATVRLARERTHAFPRTYCIFKGNACPSCEYFR